ncbi:zinc-binding dehydrogenase [Flagellimonas sp. CMM7]|uniref:zinc-dependent alcohol dehydrogenase n=1 Tax=Flagellimonas sp. CMM7 TaxID=2654676 RepID=UPI0013D25C53|nr:alcohol dehydrogenase catalytic domain-containing protein [Flagellimonas sp. CMM7]UII79878.1 alcohol dehydrogenase catalytic domain-containing protein [Flagellimonas sp. CMM7]
MRQAIMPKPGAIEFNDVEKPSNIGDKEVLISVKKIGVCGSDIHVFHGKHPFTPYPVVQGHEYSGEVVETGKAVTKFKTGDKATARPQLVCGKCGPCKRGDYNICDVLKVQGFQAPGVAQDYFVLPEDRMIKLPSSMSFEIGALVEPTAVAAHCTLKAGDLKGKNVVVTGAGPIGNLVAQFARIRGANVLITDLSEYRLQKAKDCGIEHTCNPKEEKLEACLSRVFNGEGFHVGFECAGVEIALDNLIQNVNKGGDVVAVAVYGDRPRVDVSILGDRELKLIGTLMYTHEDYEQAVKYLDNGQLITEPLITKRFPFEDYLEAYRYIDDQGDQTLKVIIDL